MFSKPLVTRYKAFTLVELLVVLGIIGILVSLLLPAIQVGREAVRRADCLNNQRQLVLALHSYESANQELPPTLSTEIPDYLLFWQAQTLPFLEHEALYQSILLDKQGGTHVFSLEARRENIPVLQCVSNPDIGKLVAPEAAPAFAFTDYCGVAGSNSDNGVFRLSIPEVNENRNEFSRISGGLSNCIIFGERPPSDFDEGFGGWLGGQNSWSASTYTNAQRSDVLFDLDLPTECGERSDFGFQIGERGNQCDVTHHWSFHHGGANFARADGSVSFVAYNVDDKVLATLATRD